MAFVTNQKGGQSLLWNGSIITLNRKMANGTMYWRCSRHSCPARITTQGDEPLQQTNGHNHAVDPTESRMEQIKSNLRKRAREEVGPVPAIYERSLMRGCVQGHEPTENEP